MTFEPGPIAPIRKEDRWTLVFVRDLRHPRPKVWTALTDPAHLDAWSPFRTDRDLGTTGPATLTMVDGAYEVDTPAVVEKADPPALLEYRWGDDLLRWELAEVDGGTRLTLRHTVQAEDQLPKVAAGWHICLDVADRLLAGNPVPVIRGAEAKKYGWQDLADAYAARLDLEEDA
ncbi:SRPBCC family protein [Virgisporangium aurantiacum]|uniref:Activator of Hsp90 ATPase homologue 1/2-like C-terminal domain-containing protein n=1 Tax=Virgisporangium aurantiacum TaxID=175570 RepID=A0A8J3Z8U9_9ACTN|nr:SRPBCC family protein [Virgisporangium aurantiacum]GIJ59504.1 hypothetical protein Vau01_070200 [Virgisporangium aurantiacum]